MRAVCSTRGPNREDPIGAWSGLLSRYSTVEMLLWRLLEVWKHVVVAYDVDVAAKVNLRIPEVWLVG